MEPPALETELKQLGLAKAALDEALLPALRDAAGAAGAQLEHVLGGLQSALAGAGHQAQETMRALGAAADESSVAVAGAVLALNQLLAKVAQLSLDMRPVADVTDQVRDIGATLTLLENAVARLQKEKRLREKDERRRSLNK